MRAIPVNRFVNPLFKEMQDMYVKATEVTSTHAIPVFK
ncbi:hypothetical protein C1A50_1961 [Paenibacillus polymyxa]|nr:hypothetical protein C1A50_1961 [Paenibacillus polymyxa]